MHVDGKEHLGGKRAPIADDACSLHYAILTEQSRKLCLIQICAETRYDDRFASTWRIETYSIRDITYNFPNKLYVQSRVRSVQNLPGCLLMSCSK